MEYTTFTPADIRDELESILATRNFQNSPTLSRFLQFVVTQALEGRENEIKEYTVGVEVLHKPTSFNPMLDASVRIHAIRLRKLLAEYYQQSPPPPAVRILLPKGSYVPVFAEVSPVIPGPTDQEYPPSEPNANHVNQESVCIIPFTSYIQQEGIDFSADGFCHFLSEKLSLFQDIRVVSFQSASQFLSNGGQLHNIGQALQVQFYLAGTLEIENQHIRAMVHLNDAFSNNVVWSQAFEGNMAEAGIMDMIDKTVTSIVSSIAGYSGVIHYRKYAIDSHLPPMSDKLAYAVFWFYHYQLNHAEAICHKAIRGLEQVLVQNEESSLGYAVLAHLYGASVVYNYPYGDDPINTAHKYIKLALTLNPNCQQAYITLGWLHILARNKEQAILNLEKGYSINPNSAFFNCELSICMAMLGEYGKSQQYLERALKMNPLPYWWLNIPSTFIAMKNRNFEKMLFSAQSMQRLPMIYDSVFEIVALYFLDNKSDLKFAVKAYQKKYKDGFAFVEAQLAGMIFDDELRQMFTSAFRDIRTLYIR